MTDNNDLANVKQYENVLELFAEEVKDNANSDTRCKLCNSKFRQEAEQYWETKRRNDSATQRFLQEKGEDISDKAIHNHMWEHYFKTKKQQSMQVIAKKLKRLDRAKNNQMDDLELVRKFLLNEMMELAEMADKQDELTRLKMSDLIIKICAQIVSVNEAKKKISDDWKPAKVIIEKLTQIVMLESAKAPAETKVILANVVETLFNQVEGINVEK